MIQYRNAVLEDLDFLCELRFRDLKMFSDQEIKIKTKTHIKKFYRDGIQHQTCLTLLGYDHDLCISSATIYLYHIMPSNENPRGIVGQITNVWVDIIYRHQGIASHMVKQLICQMKDSVGMFCLNSSNQGMELYKKLGFVKKENYFVMYTE